MAVHTRRRRISKRRTNRWPYFETYTAAGQSSYVICREPVNHHRTVAFSYTWRLANHWFGASAAGANADKAEWHLACRRNRWGQSKMTRRNAIHAPQQPILLHAPEISIDRGSHRISKDTDEIAICWNDTWVWLTVTPLIYFTVDNQIDTSFFLSRV
jgi:hypothetical protein